MGDEMLASVCELAFDVAKEGGAPSAMKNYLYLAQRPPRAYSVAQRALEEDVAFRSRVAERATPESVGEAGYLWLQRPSGWEHQFSELNPATAATPLAERPPMPEPPVIAPPAPAPQAPTPAPTVSSIEDELSSLRGLVDRLADERQNVRSSVSDLEQELETRRAENLEMSTRLSALRTELVTAHDIEASAASARDAAFVRIEELEADVARLAADLERARAEASGSTADRDAALTDLAAVTAERDELSASVASLRSDVAGSDSQIGELAERVEALSGTTSELEEKTERLTSDNSELAGRLAVAEQARIDLEAQLEEVSGKWQAAARQMTVYSGVNDQLDATVRERNALREHLARATDGIAQLRSTLGAQHDQLSSELAELEQAVGNGPEAVAETSAPAVNELEDDVVDDDVDDVDDQLDAGSDQDLTNFVEADSPATEDLFDTDSDTEIVSDTSRPFGDTAAEPGDEEIFDDQLNGALVDSATEHSATEHSATEHSATEHSATDDAFANEDNDDPQLSESVVAEDEATDSADDVDTAMTGEALEIDPFDTDSADVVPTDREADRLEIDDDEAHASSDVAEIDNDAPEDDASTGGRRRIITPGELTDEESIARHVIAVPDVVLLIDGDGVAGLGWPHLDVAARRDALGRYLGALTAESGAAADVVFQRAIGGEESLPVSRAVRVRITDDAVATSSIITTVVDGYPEEWPIAIVTDEPTVADQAEELNVTHLTNGQLLDLFLHLNADQ